MMKLVLAILLGISPVFLQGQSPKTAFVKTTNGKPALFVNDNPVTPVFYILKCLLFQPFCWMPAMVISC
ncbi:MAG TPA: hypothetical protein VJ203_14345 [Bacteroidales bacterium]|nr:hypothetical protein [Bacteroidales bacterium]